jgi:methylenetetrahydrofolate reductase (NADPH)
VAGFPEGHPATPNRLLEMDYFKAKADAGADYIVTQLFFDNRDFLDFRERCVLSDINIPIIAGIMPITSINGFKRIAELAGGSRFPARLLRALQRCQDNPERVRRVGLHFAIEQCHDLLDNDVAGIHFYTLNRSDATRMIFDSLGIQRRGNAEASSV